MWDLAGWIYWYEISFWYTPQFAQNIAYYKVVGSETLVGYNWIKSNAKFSNHPTFLLEEEEEYDRSFW